MRLKISALIFLCFFVFHGEAASAMEDGTSLVATDTDAAYDNVGEYYEAEAEQSIFAEDKELEQDAYFDEELSEQETAEELNYSGQSGIVEIDGNKYWYGEDGSPVTGWYVYGDMRMYFSPDTGAACTGIADIDGRKYFFYDNGVLYYCTGIPKINGYRYYFDNDGALYSGWYDDGGIKMYFNPTDYRAATGLSIIDGRTYLFDDYGLLYDKTGISVIGNNKYYFGQDNSLLSGWVYYEDYIMYFDPVTYACKTSVAEIDGKHYLFDENGFLCEYEGTEVVGGKKYWFNSDRSLISGWLVTDNWKLYFDPVTFEAKTGLGYVEDTPYLFNQDGVLYECDGLTDIDGDRYLFANGFQLQSGWQSCNGHKMYFSTSTYKAAKGNTSIDGKAYYFDSNGYMLDTSSAAINMLNRIGWSLNAAFNWSAGLSYYSKVPEPSSGSHVAYYSDYGFTYQKGNCFVMAAVFCAMARAMGYNAYLVEGSVPLRGGGMGPHGWVEIEQDGGVYVYDPDFTHETKNNGFRITYGTSGTWRYSNYRRVN